MINRNCTSCGRAFEIEDADLLFYQKVSPTFNDQKFEIPPPTHCRECRMQRRLSFRNERTLYKRPCSLTGKPLISMYPPDSPAPVYDYSIWNSDKWDGTEYGRAYDFSRPFFEQFRELLQVVPVPSLNQQTENENCEYTNFVSRNRNCYFIFAANDNEDCLYTTYLQRNRDVVDSFFIFDCERCYECIDCYTCYNVRYSEYCHNCRDSWFLRNCRNCKNCFGCVSLVEKEFYLFNQRYEKQEYHKRVEALLSQPNFLKIVQRELATLRMHVPQKYYAGVNNEGATGDHISYSKNAHSCFDCTYLEDCKYCTWLHRSRDCYDCYAWGLSGELGYENHLCGNNFYRIQFCESCWNDVSYLLYCRYCTNNSSHLFGCASLRHKSYCILNKQYSKEEFESLVPRIIKQMKGTGEWGEFFSSRISPFAYNETVAQEYFPLTETLATERGLRWRNDLPRIENRHTISWEKIPKEVSAVSDEICNEILCCEGCRRNFRFTVQELKFYRSMDLELPHYCFDCRYQRRRKARNPRVLREAPCAKCNVKFLTAYPANTENVLYCERCYYEAVY